MVQDAKTKKPAKILKLIHAFEMFEAIDSETDIAKKVILLQKYGASSPLSFILSLNFHSGVNLDLPEGMPPMDIKHMDQQTHPDFMGLLASNIAKLKNCVKGSKLTKKKHEQIFYDVLINCPMKDAEILCAAKDKALEELYPTITADLVKTVFPGYVK